MANELENLRKEVAALRKEKQELRAKVQQLVSRHDEIVNLFSRIDVAALFLDDQLRVERFTPQAAELFDLDDRQLSRRIEDIPSRLQDVDTGSDCRQVLQGMQLLEREVSGRDGRIFQMRILPNRNTSAAPGEGLVLAFLDITPRKKREQELSLAYERLNQAQQVSLTGNFDRNLQTGEGFWSDQVYRLFGYEPNEVEEFQERFFDHVHHEDIVRVKNILKQAIQGQAPYDVSFRYHTTTGQLRWGHSQGRVEYNAEGTPLRLYGTFQDITDFMEYEHRLQVERQRLAMALEATGAGVFEAALPLEGGVFLSPRWYELHGVEEKAIPHEYQAFAAWYASHVDQQDVEVMNRVLEEYEKGRRDWHKECYRFQKPSGEWIWVESVGRKVTYEKGGAHLVGAALDVSERMQVQQELREHRDHLQELVRQGNRELARSEALHRTVIEHFPDGSVVVFDQDLRYQLAGGEALEYIGLSAKDLVGKTVHEAFDQDFADYLADMFRRALQGESVVTELEYQEEIYEVHVLPVRDKGGDIVAGMAQTHRVTEERILERARHEQEQLYRNLVANAPDIIARFDREHRLVFVNEAIERYTRRPIKRYLGRSLDVLELEPEEQRKLVAAMERAFASGEESMAQLTVPLEGQRYVYHLRLAPERDVTGQVQTLLCVARDITGLFSLQQERERLLELIEAMPDLIFTMDPEGCLVYCNRGACDILGLEKEFKPKNMQCDLIYPEEELEELRQVFMPRAREQGFWSGESRLLCREGRKLPVKQTVVCQMGDEEQGELFSVIAHDLSRLKQREHDLYEAKERAEAASNSKSEFLANMSHELRTPIAGILGMTSLLLKDPGVTLARDKLEMIHQAGQSLLNIINDVLDLSKIEAKGLELEHKPFPLQQLVKHLQAMFEHQARSKGLAFSVRVDELLPQQLVGDEQRIAQVLRNLVSNAIKFTERGSVRVWLQLVQLCSDSLEMACSVSDTGAGINSEDKSRLFTSFTQLDSSYSKAHGGTGLGLAICKELVELMQGRLELESAPGEGSRFTVLLWLGRDDLKAQSQEQQSLDKMQQAPESVQALRVLAVDDNNLNRMYIGEMLEELGMRARLEESGADALQALEEETFDCVLMDVQMPGMDGMEVTQRIRESGAPWQNIPIIALTAYAMKGDRERFLDAGMDEYLAKPVEGESLLQAIETVMGGQVPSLSERKTRSVSELQKGKAKAEDPGAGTLEDMAAEEREWLEARLRKLRQGRALCREFLKDLPSKRQAIEQAQAEGDLKALANAAHSLGGAAGVLGLQRLLEQVRVVDDKDFPHRPQEQRQAAVTMLLRRMEAARQAIEAELADSPDS